MLGKSPETSLGVAGASRLIVAYDASGLCERPLLMELLAGCPSVIQALFLAGCPSVTIQALPAKPHRPGGRGVLCAGFGDERWHHR